MSKARERIVRNIYKRLFTVSGHQHWWPGNTQFEVIVGAILTQNTNWGNVEKAINNLKQAKCLNPKSLNSISKKKLASLIKPAGYFNVKAKRLKNFLFFLFNDYKGSLKAMAKQDWPALRQELLKVNGIGPETADSILLYAFNKPIFVVDTYTKRIFSRHGIVNDDSDYMDIQDLFMKTLKHDVQLFNEYHALIVNTGKYFCKPKRQCEQCPLNKRMYYLS